MGSFLKASLQIYIYIYICVCVCLKASLQIYIYIYICVCISETQKKKISKLVLIEFSILYHVSLLIFNFVSSKLLCVKIKESKSN